MLHIDNVIQRGAKHIFLQGSFEGFRSHSCTFLCFILGLLKSEAIILNFDKIGASSMKENAYALN